MLKTLTAVIFAAALPCLALAQSSPNLTFGQVPTPAQWNSYFAGKQDVLGFTPMNQIGGTFLGRVVTAPPGASTSGLNLTPGTAPGSPANGDLWVTTLGVYAQINGSTVGPLTSAATPCSVCALTSAPNIFTASPQMVQGLTTTSPGWYTQITGDTFARVRIGLNATDVPSIAFGPGNVARDTFLERFGVASLRFGAPDAAAPVAQVLGVQNVVAGTSNTAGANLTINGSRGTGTGSGGDILLQVAPLGSSGATQNPLTTALHIFGADGGVTLGAPTGGDKGLGALNAAAIYVNGVAVAGGIQTLANGGTNNALTASNGGVVYSDATKLNILAGTVTANLCLLSQSSAPPVWGACAGGAAVASVTNSDGSLTISPTTGAVVASLGTTIPNIHNFQQGYFNGGASAGSNTSPYYQHFVDCVRPEQYGAVRDAVTNDTNAIIQAANAALAGKLGVCLQSNLRYQITPIQFGGSQLTTGGITGSISGVTLTITAFATPLQITLGTVISGGTCSANTFVTAIGTTALGAGASGFIGTYTVNNSQTCTPTTITPPNITATFAGTVATITVNSGKLNLYDSLVFAGVTLGQTIVAQTSGTTGLSGTYTLAYAETVSSPTTMLAYPYSIASLPKAFKGSSPGAQQDTQIGFFGSSAVNAAVLKIVDPPALGANIGLDVGNFRVIPFGFAANCMMVHGLAETSAGGIPLIHDIDCGGSTAAVGKNCAFNFVGNSPGGPSYGIISAGIHRLSSNQASICDFNFDGNNGDNSLNIQGVHVDHLSGNSSSSGAGYYFDYTNLDAGTLISQDHTGAAFVWGHANYFTVTSIYDEANGAASSCTSNSHGLTLRGQMLSGLGAACLNDQSGDISVFNGTAWLRNNGRQQGSLNTFASYPACAAGTEGSLVSITDSTTTTTGGTIAGSGSNHVLGYCNGTNYVVVTH